MVSLARGVLTTKKQTWKKKITYLGTSSRVDRRTYRLRGSSPAGTWDYPASCPPARSTTSSSSLTIPGSSFTRAGKPLVCVEVGGGWRGTEAARPPRKFWGSSSVARLAFSALVVFVFPAPGFSSLGVCNFCWNVLICCLCCPIVWRSDLSAKLFFSSVFRCVRKRHCRNLSCVSCLVFAKLEKLIN